MKLDVNEPIKNRNKEAIKADGGKTFTIGLAIVNSLDAPSSEKIDGQEKTKRFMLAARVVVAMENGGIFEMGVDDATLIKKVVDDFYPSPLVVAPVWQAVDAAGNTK